MSHDLQLTELNPVEHTVIHKFYKGNPHPYDESLPSFAVINVQEMTGEDGAQKLTCEFVTVAPNPKPDEETHAYGWRLLVEQISILKDDTREGIFTRVKKLVEERVKIAYIVASQTTRDTMVFSAGHAFRLKYEITEDQFLQILGRSALGDSTLLDNMIERSKVASFRELITRFKGI